MIANNLRILFIIIKSNAIHYFFIQFLSYFDEVALPINY